MYVWRKGPERLRTVLIDQRDVRDTFLEALLFDKGLTIIERIPSLQEASLLRSLPDCDLVVVLVPADPSAMMSDLATFTSTHAYPVLAVFDGDEGSYVGALHDAGVSSVLCVGVGSDRMRAAAHSAIAVFDRVTGLRRQVDAAQQNLRDRKQVERAKGILMQQRSISESEAFRELQMTSMRRNESLPDVAGTIIAAKELLG